MAGYTGLLWSWAVPVSINFVVSTWFALADVLEMDAYLLPSYLAIRVHARNRCWPGIAEMDSYHSMLSHELASRTVRAAPDNQLTNDCTGFCPLGVIGAGALISVPTTRLAQGPRTISVNEAFACTPAGRQGHLQIVEEEQQPSGSESSLSERPMPDGPVFASSSGDRLVGGPDARHDRWLALARMTIRGPLGVLRAMAATATGTGTGLGTESSTGRTFATRSMALFHRLKWKKASRR
ncbi:hypothetical protein B2J93_3947 [Marssonina coronariae]|uniref:Uncharacterized protein n=1 Tax=Diplocarpon coronariae TaxID=2795749 RepID=A0A218YX53_9HELO|nr:hypothetical protein B2J93_3947 [Marssonina coronariae]